MKKKSEEVIEDIVECLRLDYKPQKVILFGSYAWGDPSADSDIDLLIIKDTKVRFFKRLAQVRRIARDARKGRSFEPIVLTPGELKKKVAGQDAFIGLILKRGKLLYAA